MALENIGENASMELEGRGHGPYIKIALAFLENDILTFKEIVEKTGMSRRTIAKILRELEGKKMIERVVKSRKRVYYYFPDPYNIKLITKTLWYELGRPSRKEYSEKLDRIGEKAWEAEEMLYFFYSLALSIPFAKVDYHSLLGFYLVFKSEKVKLDVSKYKEELKIENDEGVLSSLPTRLNLRQCLDRYVKSFGLEVFTEEDLERIGVEIKKDQIGYFFDRGDLQKIYKLKESREIFYVEKPRSKTINKISRLIYLLWLNRETLKDLIRVKPEDIIVI